MRCYVGTVSNKDKVVTGWGEVEESYEFAMIITSNEVTGGDEEESAGIIMYPSKQHPTTDWAQGAAILLSGPISGV